MAEIPAHWIHEETLGPADVGKIFDVDPRTVSKWASKGVIGFFRTPHGLRRFPVCEVQRLMAAEPPEDQQLLLDLAAQDKRKYKEMWRGGWRRGSKAIERQAGFLDEDET